MTLEKRVYICHYKIGDKFAPDGITGIDGSIGKFVICACVAIAREKPATGDFVVGAENVSQFMEYHAEQLVIR